MRFNPIPDADFYVEVPDKWDHYCTYPAKKNWREPKYQQFKGINYYRDLEGNNIDIVKESDLYELERPTSRINPWACLPYLYATGERFIKLEKAKPSGFKCSEMPLSLREARAMNDKIIEDEIKMEEQQAYEAKLKAACEEAEK